MNRAALLDPLPLHAGEPDPTSTLLVLMETIAYAIVELPARQRMVFDLRLLQHRSVAETAIELGIAEGTVKATLHQACGNMRRMIHAAAVVTEDGDIWVLRGGRRTISRAELIPSPDWRRRRNCVMKWRLPQALTHALAAQEAYEAISAGYGEGYPTPVAEWDHARDSTTQAVHYEHVELLRAHQVRCACGEVKPTPILTQ
ncbi:MAG: sigma factor-like helix-turn-helix DNA-binding protein [Gemmatimonadaceae bacterium]